jgi:hypothetical protein
MGGCQQLRAVMRQTLLEAALGAAQEQTVNGAADADMQQ